MPVCAQAWHEDPDRPASTARACWLAYLYAWLAYPCA